MINDDNIKDESSEQLNNDAPEKEQDEQNEVVEEVSEEE